MSNEIRTTAVDFSFGELLNLHKSQEIIIRPEYQRLFRWTNEQRSRLIESVLMGLPIPPIFLIEDENGVLELIDGLQRTSSALQFLDHRAIGEDELILEGCDIINSLNGKKYSDLETSEKFKIKRTPIRATIINKGSSSFVKYELFKRLNTGGALLSAQEIRNCSSRMVEGGAEFYEMLQELARRQSFVATTRRLSESQAEKRANEELVLRFFALVYYRDGYKGHVEEWLDSFMEDVLFNKLDFNLPMAKSRFERVFGLIEDKLEDTAFTRFNTHGEPTGRLAPAYYEAVVATFDEHYDTIQLIERSELAERLRSAFSSDEFKTSTGPGANTITKLRDRIEVVSRHLIGNDAA